jgi:hypothetical protein
VYYRCTTVYQLCRHWVDVRCAAWWFWLCLLQSLICFPLQSAHGDSIWLSVLAMSLFIVGVLVIPLPYVCSTILLNTRFMPLLLPFCGPIYCLWRCEKCWLGAPACVSRSTSSSNFSFIVSNFLPLPDALHTCGSLRPSHDLCRVCAW